MFKASGTRIQISRGDTGVLTFAASGVELTDNDRAVFTVRSRNGAVVMEKVAVPEDNKVHIPFLNEETQRMREGDYAWDIRYALGAVLDEEGRVTDGHEVLTPMFPGVLTIEKVVGQI